MLTHEIITSLLILLYLQIHFSLCYICFSIFMISCSQGFGEQCIINNFSKCLISAQIPHICEEMGSNTTSGLELCIAKEHCDLKVGRQLIMNY